MDLSKIVEENNKEQEKKNELAVLQRKTLREFEKFMETSKKLYNLTDRKRLELENQLKNDLDKFLTDNGFEMGDREYMKDGVLIIANGTRYLNGSTEIKLSPIKYDENELEVNCNIEINPTGIYKSIILKPQIKDSDKLFCKKNIKYKNDYLSDSNYKEFINKINDIKVLNDIISDISINNEHYISTINDFDNIEYRYSLYKDDREFETIYDVIKAM
ncbi:hypothetical protein [Clostridium perfringens]|uniref:hypothetical protein n=1 Tax=Clostridium perfringens TaxID=1502 RepID=UPI002852FB89|nr:hypothetical protein [Clostridium perfringens]CAJ1611244.1 hypothetical protein CLO5623_02734 [Clostridium perfringens]